MHYHSSTIYFEFRNMSLPQYANLSQQSLLTALELFLTTSWTITRVLTSSIRGINYRWYIASSSILTLLNWYGYSWLRTVPYLTEYNEGNNAGIYFYTDSLEHGTCAINDMAIIAGGLNV